MAGTALASAAPGKRYAALVATCGREYYGLPAGEEALFSPDWFLVQRAGAWIAKARAAVDDAELVKRLDAALAKNAFVMPLPPIGPGYTLARTSQLREALSMVYVVVTADGLRLARMPELRLGADGAQLGGVPFPGETVTIDELAQRLDQLAEAPPDDQDGVDAKEPLGRAEERERAQKYGVLGKPPMNVRREDDPPPPLYFADAALPAARLFEVLGRASRHGADLAAFHDGKMAAHHVGFLARARVDADDIAIVHLSIDDAGFAVWIGKDLARIPRAGDAYDYAALASWRARAAPSTSRRARGREGHRRRSIWRAERRRREASRCGVPRHHAGALTGVRGGDRARSHGRHANSRT